MNEINKPMNNPTLKTQFLLETQGDILDCFLKAASIASFKETGRSTAVVSYKYATNITENNINDYTFSPNDRPLYILIPFERKHRFVLAFFDTTNKIAKYYDSLKEPPAIGFYLIKHVVEGFAKDPISFKIEVQDIVNDTVNNNTDINFANLHICCIAEQLCFTGRSEMLKPFVISVETERIQKLFSIISQPNWNGIWSTRGHFNFQIETILSHIPKILKNTENSNIDNAVTISKPIELQRNLNKCVTEYSVKDYEETYPILATMLSLYQRFEKHKKTFHTKTWELKKSSSFKISEWEKMNNKEFEVLSESLTDFPYLCDLKESEKDILINSFKQSFHLLERIYDTLTKFASTEENFIALQNGDCYILDSLNEVQFEAEQEKTLLKIILKHWKICFAKLKDLQPDIIEMMFIFCCQMWNCFFSKLSEDGEETILRGRLIIHHEMRKFYDYDNLKWKRMYTLKDVIQKVVDFVMEYKQASSTSELS